MPSILICTDLDRTLLPNGLQPESPKARPTLRRLFARPEVTLAYVSGRRLELHLEAMQAYDHPCRAAPGGRRRLTECPD